MIAVLPESRRYSLAAKLFFTQVNRAVLITTRKASSKAAVTGDLSTLPADQQAVIRKIAGALQAETSVDKLKQSLKQMDEQAGSAPVKSKPFLTLRRKLIEDRIAELQKEKK